MFLSKVILEIINFTQFVLLAYRIHPLTTSSKKLEQFVGFVSFFPFKVDV